MLERRVLLGFVLKKTNELDEIDMWYKAHDPKKNLDANTAVKKKQLDDELAKLSQSCSVVERNVVFKKVIGEDSNGYVKTYGKGLVVPRSRKKRCALEEERAMQLKTEEDVANMKKELDLMKNLMTKMAMQQGINVGSSSGQAGGEECGENCESSDDM